MDRWRGKVAVVTGASSGIGLATAKAFVQEGMIVVGLARRKDKMLQEMSNIKGSGKFHAVECDITKKNEVVEAFEFIKKNLKTVHVLINNAGTVKIKSIEDSNIEDLEEIINLNVLALLNCSKHAIKLMKENGDEGHIVNINSVAGHKHLKLPVPVNVYPASKFAVTAISDTLTNELRGSKIRVTDLSPGYVITEITQQNQVPGEKPALQAEDVANSVVYVVGVPHHVQITELMIRPLGEDF